MTQVQTATELTVDWLLSLSVRLRDGKWRYFHPVDLGVEADALGLEVFDDVETNADYTTLFAYHPDGSWGFWERPRSEKGRDWNCFHNNFKPIKTREEFLKLADVLGLYLEEDSTWEEGQM